jgi:hypothetical protein
MAIFLAIRLEPRTFIIEYGIYSFGGGRAKCPNFTDVLYSLLVAA